MHPDDAWMDEPVSSPMMDATDEKRWNRPAVERLSWPGGRRPDVTVCAYVGIPSGQHTYTHHTDVATATDRATAKDDVIVTASD